MSAAAFVCAACANAEPKPLAVSIPFDVKSGRDTAFGAVFRCPDCGLGRVDPLPTVDQIPEHYKLDAYYTHGINHMADVGESFADRVLTRLAYAFDDGEDQSRLLGDVVRARLRDAGDVRVLDIGCGGGTTAKRLIDLGASVSGVDPDPAARENAKAKGLEVFDGTAEDLPDEVLAQRYDLVVLSHVLEHTLDPAAVLRRIAGLLKPGGRLYCEVPNAGCEHFRKFSQISEMLDIPRHLYFFNKASLAHLATGSGMQVVAWHYSGFTRHHKPNWRAWEAGIHDRLRKRGITPSVATHSFANSLSLMMASRRLPAERKYDCISFFAAPSD